MEDSAVSCRASGSRLGRVPQAVASAVAGAVIVLTGTACSTASSGAPAPAQAPAVTVLKQGANNGNGDISSPPAGAG